MSDDTATAPVLSLADRLQLMKEVRLDEALVDEQKCRQRWTQAVASAENTEEQDPVITQRLALVEATVVVRALDLV